MMDNHSSALYYCYYDNQGKLTIMKLSKTKWTVKHDVLDYDFSPFHSMILTIGFGHVSSEVNR